jgi:hypothetical protein
MKFVNIIFFLFSITFASIIKDGGFEDARFSDSKWTENATPDWNKIVCSNQTCQHLNDYEPKPRTGLFFAWFSGFGLLESSGNVSQMFNISKQDATLLFYLQMTSTGSNRSSLKVYIDDDLILSFDENDTNRYKTYQPVSVKVKFSRLGEHRLSFGYNSYKESKYYLTHYLIDDVSMC